MPPSTRYEQQFLDALKAIFVGTKVEGGLQLRQSWTRG